MDKQKITPLVIKAQQGDKKALQELFASCYDSLYYFAYKTTKSEALAADITQESCIEIMKTLDKLKDPNAFSTWAHQITYHQCTRHFRGEKELLLDENEDGETILDILPDESEGSLPEQVIEDEEFQKTLQEMLNQLPTEQRSALLLYYFENLSVKQIANIQGTTEGTVKSRLNYGRKAVKQQVEDYEKKNGIKLHSLAPLPLLLAFLFKQGKDSASGAAASALPAVSKAVNSAVFASGTGSLAAKIAGAPLMAKILIPAAAVALVAAATVGIVHAVNRPAEGKDPSDVGGGFGHIHQYTHWEFDKDNHWQACDCGEKTEAEPHNYVDRVCSVCGGLYESEGLFF